jgi:hypothetical protein
MQGARWKCTQCHELHMCDACARKRSHPGDHLLALYQEPGGVSVTITYSCDGCGSKIQDAVRYRCHECTNFDLCGHCMSKGCYGTYCGVSSAHQ